MLCVATGTNVTLRLNKVLFLYLLNACDSRLLITAPCYVWKTKAPDHLCPLRPAASLFTFEKKK